jgi:hypothetical protein
MKGVIQRRGIPLALYSDRHFVFRHPDPANEGVEAPLADQRRLTQFGRAMRELGVTQVFARSPEAKGYASYCTSSPRFGRGSPG